MGIVYEKFPYTDEEAKRSRMLENIKKKTGIKDITISFYDEETFLERKKAEEKLADATTPIAVHYIEWNEAQGRPKKFQGYRDRAEEILAKAKEVEETPHYVGVKQATLGCKACKKRIDITEMQVTNNCPFCGASQLPSTKTKLIEKYKADAEKLKERADAEELEWIKGKCSKGTHRWLVAYNLSE